MTGQTNKQMINLCSTTVQAAQQNEPCIVYAMGKTCAAWATQKRAK